MLRLLNISLGYEDFEILKNINMEFKAGEITVVTGNSGSGKSSIIKLLNGIIPEFESASIRGSIIYNEVDITNQDINEKSKYISTVFQNPKNQFYTINSFDELAFGLENKNIPRDEIYKRIGYYSRLLNIEDLLGKDIFKLSGGQKQLVAIASVVCMNQEIYIFDEPSSSLDHDYIERLGSILKILKDLGKIVIVMEHRLYYLKTLMDKLYVLNSKSVDLVDKDNIYEFSKYNLREIEETKQSELSENMKIKSMFDKKYEDADDLKFIDYRYSYKRGNDVFNMNMSMNKDINFIIGENGIGKTTFVRCLCGLNKGFKGKTYYKGNLIKNPSNFISLVMQDVNYQLFTDSVWNEISIVTDNNDEKIEILDMLGLLSKKDQHPQCLSGGEKQRLSIALCIASKKPIVVLDEPTSGLCKNNMDMFIRYLKKMVCSKKKIIVITHDYEFIKRCGGNIINLVK